MASSPRENATSVENMATEQHISGETDTKYTTIETTANNLEKIGHIEVDCWVKKEKDDDINNLFVGDKLCGEVQEYDKKR